MGMGDVKASFLDPLLALGNSGDGGSVVTSAFAADLIDLP